MQKEWKLTLTKLAKRQLREDVVEEHVTKMLASANNGRQMNAGWYIEKDMIGEGDRSFGHTSVWRDEPTFFTLTGNPAEGYEGKVHLKVIFDKRDKQPDTNVLNALLKSINTKASKVPMRWELAEIDGEPWVEPDEILGGISGEAGYVEVNIPDNFEEYFTHLIGLDEALETIRDALETAIITDWKTRNNVALIGPPGCGKSDICRSLKRALGEDSVLEFDATAMTTAGVIKLLENRDLLPRVMLIEEIEKSPRDSTNFLLALSDIRAEIRKTTTRDDIQRDINVFVICTVNSETLFEERASGALASRFNNPIYFERPSRDMLGKILEREVLNMNGNFSWIEPTLDYCDEIDETDPRRVISLCTTYRDKWNTGRAREILNKIGKGRKRLPEVDWSEQ